MSRHGHSCRWSEGRYQGHAAINDIILCTSTSAGVPARLEPPGLLRRDSRRSDGVLIVPWRSGKFLVRHATCINTSPSYQGLAVQTADSVAAKAESLKKETYSDLSHTHEFAPIAVESSGVFGLQSLIFVKEYWGGGGLFIAI